MKKRKSANKQTNERKREIKLPQTKNQYEKPIKKTPNQHTQSIIQEEEKYDKKKRQVSINFHNHNSNSYSFENLLLQKNTKL